MRYFIDTEFYEDGTNIYPISVGIVAEDGREFYAELPLDTSIIPESHFVRDHVLTNTYLYGQYQILMDRRSFALVNALPHVVRNEIEALVKDDLEPRFYGYFAGYDWVVLCQLFGTMMQLPVHFPKWCVDLKQMAWERGRDSTWIKENVPQPDAQHNALADARWNAQLYAALTQSIEVRFLPAPGEAPGMFTAYDVPMEGIEVMAGALQAFLATPEGPNENATSQGYRAVGRLMLDAMYKASQDYNKRVDVPRSTTAAE